MPTPKLSIIVPVYNVAPYLERCLCSLLGQTLAEIEIICVDDKSSDGSLDILRDYARRDPRLVVIEHPVNLGTGHARNSGLMRARAPYITFVDSDDYVDLDAYEYLMQCMTPETDLLCFGGEVENENPNAFDAYFQDVMNVTEETTRPFSLNEIFIRTPFPVDKIYRASIIRENGVTFAPTIVAEDIAFWTLAGLYVKTITLTRRKCYHYMRNDNSYTGSLLLAKRSKSIINAIDTTQHVVRHLKQRGLFSTYKQIAFIYMLQRVSSARFHAKASYRWRIYVKLARYMLTTWLGHWGMAGRLLMHKARKGHWPDLDLQTAPSLPVEAQ